MMSNTKRYEQGFPGGFTVLMAVYGKDDSELFAKAVASVYGNELKPDHMVLVVDGPVPAQLEHQILSTEQQHGTEVVRLDTTRGLAEALNAGLAHINTEWVVRADADDYNLPQRFRQISELLHTQTDLDLIGSAILETERDGTPVACRVMPVHHEEILKFLTRRNPFNHMTVAYRRSLVERCGGYPNVYLREDYALWVIMIMSGARCANLSEVLVHATAGRDMYRRRSGWRYAKAERDMQALMVRLGLKSRLHGALDGIARSSVFLSPVFLRRLIYERLLRRSARNVSEAMAGKK
jgi:glycosyltransferase involved in cell wall biosynthesis